MTKTNRRGALEILEGAWVKTNWTDYTTILLLCDFIDGLGPPFVMAFELYLKDMVDRRFGLTTEDENVD
jgi:hypothetical protein